MNLKNKKIIITGATGGIGHSLVKKFTELGSLVLASGTNEEKLEKLKDEFKNIQIENFKLDNHDKIDSFIETAHKKLGGLDVLINNAGITLDNLSIRLTEENWKKVLDINVTATFLMCKYSIKKCVSPGFIKTEMTNKINEEFKKMLINKIPSGDLGTGEDVSNCVAFLASDMSNYINGETIHVNGGMYMA